MNAYDTQRFFPPIQYDYAIISICKHSSFVSVSLELKLKIILKY